MGSISPVGLVPKVFVAVFVLGLLMISKAGSFNAVASENFVVLYDAIPGMEQSEVYSITVNDQDLFVEKFHDVHIARFSFDGHVEVSVQTNDPVSSFDISPHSKGIQSDVQGNRLTFGLTDPAKLIVRVNSHDKLFIFADGPEQGAPNLDDSHVVNILDYGVDNTGTVNERSKIQQALNDVAAMSEGGVLYFPDGVYRTGSLSIGSNTHLYLESGALIQGSYWEPGSMQERIVMRTGHMTTIAGLLYAAEQKNIKISGRGIIDADGYRHREAGVGGGRLLFIVKSENVHVQDVVLRDARSWNTHLYHSDHITLKNVKVVNNPINLTTDGIDPDNSRHVMIDDVFVYAGDDSIAIKSGRWYFGPTRIPDRDVYDVTVQNSVLWSRAASAMKVGSETDGEKTYDITFMNNDVVSADIALHLWVADGTELTNVKYIDNRVEQVNSELYYHHGKRMPIYFQITKRNPNSKPGIIKDVLVQNLEIEQFGAEWSVFRGLDENHKISNVVFENLRVDGQIRTTMEDARIRSNGLIENITFEVTESTENGKCPRTCPPSDHETAPVLLFHDDFSTDAVDGLPSKWQVTTSSGMSIVEDETITAGQSLKMVARPAATVRIDRDFSTEKPIVMAEYLFKWTEQNSTINHYIRSNDQTVVNLHFDKGHVHYRYVGDEGRVHTVDVGPLMEEWNRIRVMADAEESVFYVYLNDMDKPMSGPIPLMYPVKTWQDFSLRFFQRQEQTRVSESYYSDISVWGIDSEN